MEDEVGVADEVEGVGVAEGVLAEGVDEGGALLLLLGFSTLLLPGGVPEGVGVPGVDGLGVAVEGLGLGAAWYL